VRSNLLWIGGSLTVDVTIFHIKKYQLMKITLLSKEYVSFVVTSHVYAPSTSFNRGYLLPEYREAGFYITICNPPSLRLFVDTACSF